VISPDAGGVERAGAFAKRLDVSLGIIDKRRDREKKNVAKVMHIVGDVAGRDVLVVDDMVDTAGTLVEATTALRRAGARRVYAGATHAVLSGQRCNGWPLRPRTTRGHRYDPTQREGSGMGAHPGFCRWRLSW